MRTGAVLIVIMLLAGCTENRPEPCNDCTPLPDGGAQDEPAAPPVVDDVDWPEGLAVVQGPTTFSWVADGSGDPLTATFHLNQSATVEMTVDAEGVEGGAAWYPDMFIVVPATQPACGDGWPPLYIFDGNEPLVQMTATLGPGTYHVGIIPDSGNRGWTLEFDGGGNATTPPTSSLATVLYDGDDLASSGFNETIDLDGSWFAFGQILVKGYYAAPPTNGGATLRIASQCMSAEVVVGPENLDPSAQSVVLAGFGSNGTVQFVYAPENQNAFGETWLLRGLAFESI